MGKIAKMKRFICLWLLVSSAHANDVAHEIKIEALRGVIDPQTVADLTGLACRNYDKIVHLKITVIWPTSTGSLVDGDLIFSTPDTEFLFHREGFRATQDGWAMNGYYIVRSGGTHQGVTSDSFERIEDAPVFLNPYVKEITANGPDCSYGPPY